MLSQIDDLTPHDKTKGSYFKACQHGSCLCSALEVFSQAAMAQLTFKGRDRCRALVSPELREDAWMQQCMDALDVHAVPMPVVSGGTCEPSEANASSPLAALDCSLLAGNASAFSPVRSITELRRCLEDAAS